MTIKNLQQKMDHFGGALNMMRNSQIGTYPFPVASEFSNWREEQRAWREGVALMDQSYHMTDLYVKGKDAFKLVADLSINSFANFGDNKAKQMIACAPSGHLIGDMVLFGLGDDLVNIVGRPSVANWVEFMAQKGGYDVELDRDERTVGNPKPRKTFRFEIQGPDAWALLEKLNKGSMDVPRFFHMSKVNIAGHDLRSLRHGMGGAPGLEFWGPVEHGPEVKAAIIEAGKEFGLRLVGSRAYSSAAVDSGWFPCPMPAIYSGEDTRDYREWLGVDNLDANASLGGSYISDNIEDYYLNPWELDYGRLIRFDHDFVGREALEGMQNQQHRKKVSIIWNADDVGAIARSQMSPGKNAKYLEMPMGHYASYPYDKIINNNGDVLGFSSYSAFLAPDSAMVSLGVVDEAHAEPGTEITFIWGEPNGGSNRPPVEPHIQMPIRGTIATWPFSQLAQSGYRGS